MIQLLVSMDGPASGPVNMSLDLELLAKASKGIVAARTYRWMGAWVSLGKFQRPESALLSPIPFVMRPTGGKAVLHGHDVTVGLAVPLDVIGCGPKDVKRAYRRASRPLIEALNDCGVPAALAEESGHVHRSNRTADCFAANSANDIVNAATGAKVCGCALLVNPDAVLLQASIPIGAPLVDPKLHIVGATDYQGEEWDLTDLGRRLEVRLRYNFAHVSA